jgi:hypothetical protein
VSPTLPRPSTAGTWARRSERATLATATATHWSPRSPGGWDWTPRTRPPCGETGPWSRSTARSCTRSGPTASASATTTPSRDASSSTSNEKNAPAAAAPPTGAGSCPPSLRLADPGLPPLLRRRNPGPQLLRRHRRHPPRPPGRPACFPLTPYYARIAPPPSALDPPTPVRGSYVAAERWRGGGRALSNSPGRMGHLERIRHVSLQPGQSSLSIVWVAA